MTTTETAVADLRHKILRMGSLAENILAKAWRCVSERSVELADEVRKDDLQIDQLDIEIDEATLRALALQAPVAASLRQVVAAKSAATDLERVGDLARNIAKSGARLAARPSTSWVARIEPLQAAARQSLQSSLDAFQRIDADAAREVIRFDDEIDALQDRFVRDAIEAIAESPELSSQLVDTILIAESLERVGDHATNIAEDVILVAEAVNVKHAAKLGPPRR